MQDGAARLLRSKLKSTELEDTQRRVLQNAYDHLISRDAERGWTSGQWMTERSGGSDVSQTETLATYDPSFQGVASAEDDIPLGPWRIDGFKWFSSATDAKMTILLAKTGPSGKLTAFFAPMHRQSPSPAGQELNGVRISRLKNKLGTKPVPTAELELKNTRAYMLGKEGRGVQEISDVLTVTRVHCAVASVGYLGRALGVAKAYAAVREVGARRGRRVPLRYMGPWLDTMAGVAVGYHGLLVLTLFAAFALGVEEHGLPEKTSPMAGILPADHALHAPLLRALTPLIKAYVCKKAIPLIYECMEALGGIGYLNNEEDERWNVSRLFRDACVQSIWEGTTDVLASDFIRALRHSKEGGMCGDALEHVILAAGARIPHGKDVIARWKVVREEVVGGREEDVMGGARGFLFRAGECLEMALVGVDAATDGDEVVADISQRLVERYHGASGGELKDKKWQVGDDDDDDDHAFNLKSDPSYCLCRTSPGTPF